MRHTTRRKKIDKKDILGTRKEGERKERRGRASLRTREEKRKVKEELRALALEGNKRRSKKTRTKRESETGKKGENSLHVSEKKGPRAAMVLTASLTGSRRSAMRPLL